MRVVFWIKDACRSHPPTYTHLNRATGFSGSETAVTELATQAARFGHDVHVVCHGVEDGAVLDNGVWYVPRVPDDGIDVFVPMFFAHNPEVLQALTRLAPDAVVVMWMQCILRPHMWAASLPMLTSRRTLVVGPTNFSLQLLPDALRERFVIPNALNPDVYPYDPALLRAPERRLGTWVFHACWERGGEVALRVFARYPQRRTMLVSGYYPGAEAPDEGLRRNLGSLSKHALRDALSDCDYFVYPLVAPNGTVQHDTFGCVVLEAMARGVICVAWRTACLPELYGDHAVLVDPPPYCQGSPAAAFGRCGAMNGEDSVRALLDAVTSLDADPVAKEALRARAMRWACSQTWANSGAKLDSLLASTSCVQG